MATPVDRLQWPATNAPTALTDTLLAPLQITQNVEIIWGVYAQDYAQFTSHVVGMASRMNQQIMNRDYTISAIGAAPITWPNGKPSKVMLNTAIMVGVHFRHMPSRVEIEGAVKRIAQILAYELGNVATGPEMFQILAVYTWNLESDMIASITQSNTLQIPSDPTQPYVPLGVPGERQLPGQSEWEQHVREISNLEDKLKAYAQLYEAKLKELDQYVQTFQQVAQAVPNAPDLQEYGKQVVKPYTDQLKAEFTTMLQNIQAELEKLAALREQVGAQGTEIANLKSAISEIKTTLATYNEQLDNRLQQIDNVNQQLDRLTKAVQAVATAQGQADPDVMKKLDELSNAIDELNKTLADLENEPKQKMNLTTLGIVGAGLLVLMALHKK